MLSIAGGRIARSSVVTSRSFSKPRVGELSSSGMPPIGDGSVRTAKEQSLRRGCRTSLGRPLCRSGRSRGNVGSRLVGSRSRSANSAARVRQCRALRHPSWRAESAAYAKRLDAATAGIDNCQLRPTLLRSFATSRVAKCGWRGWLGYVSVSRLVGTKRLTCGPSGARPNVAVSPPSHAAETPPLPGGRKDRDTHDNRCWSRSS